LRFQEFLKEAAIPQTTRGNIESLRRGATTRNRNDNGADKHYVDQRIAGGGNGATDRRNPKLDERDDLIRKERSNGTPLKKIAAIVARNGYPPLGKSELSEIAGPKHRPSKPDAEALGKYSYEECHKRTRLRIILDEIARKFGKRISRGTMKRQAGRYAKMHGLPPIPGPDPQHRWGRIPTEDPFEKRLEDLFENGTMWERILEQIEKEFGIKLSIHGAKCRINRWRTLNGRPPMRPRAGGPKPGSKKLPHNKPERKMGRPKATKRNDAWLAEFESARTGTTAQDFAKSKRIAGHTMRAALHEARKRRVASRKKSPRSKSQARTF
jgi:hypothetical protein